MATDKKRTLKKDKGVVTVTQVDGKFTYTTKDGEKFDTAHEAKTHIKPDWEKDD
tara:strand:- start:678 stop:839 length:162 start_codon:yes stop_codon:yes gene_type:complete